MHRAPAAVAALAAALVLTACGGSDDTDDASSDSETPSDSTASATDPAASPTAEDDDSDDSTRPDRSDRPNSPEGDSESTDKPSSEGDDAPTRADLRSALLTRSEMPPRWSEVPADDDDSGNLCDVDISELLGVPERSLLKADVEFSLDEDAGPTVAESLGLVPSGRASEVLDGLREGFDDCEDEDVEGLPVTVSELDFPTLGDDSAAYEIHVDTGQGSLDIPVVYAISGDLVIGVYTIDFSQDPVPLLEKYAPRAVDKAIRVLA